MTNPIDSNLCLDPSITFNRMFVIHMYSLKKDLTFPENWFYPTLPQTEYKSWGYQKYLDFGVFEKNDKSLKMYMNTSGAPQYAFPNGNQDQLFQFLLMTDWTLLYDEMHDYGDISREDSIKVYKRTKRIIMTNELPLDPTPLDKCTHFIVNKIKEKSPSAYMENLVLNLMIGWIDVGTAHLDLSRMKEVPSLSVVDYLRTTNIAIELCIMTIIHSQGYNESLLFSDPSWKELTKSIAQIVYHLNDIVSWEVEKMQSGTCNAMSIKIHNGMTPQQAYLSIIQDIDNLVKYCLELEGELGIRFPNLNCLEKCIKSAYYCATGIFCWSLTSERYKTKDSIFKELVSTNEQVARSFGDL
ncbi:hypothetical protein DFA_11666 [Cavenderia fasciculata]|uniref:Terpene synthase n=1 Tax=Cavenderia fasciculata TaxID=261658 RepID=F4QDV8_CACFS|nr:uncharacterized protein DFA_11666 [Cavenderia fasciculata]EGG13905.1 hypothetical protein DFA_11666 [Cavenderia fasciculata]|eukprot:XP_004350613.1 hypothetical protein DFA_11666 [Cavenderia fasciculata]